MGAVDGWGGRAVVGGGVNADNCTYTTIKQLKKIFKISELKRKYKELWEMDTYTNETEQTAQK